MCDVTPTVLVYADLHEFDGEFPEIYKQEWESSKSADAILKLLSEVGERTEFVATPGELLEKLKYYSDLDFTKRPVLFHLMEGFRSRNRDLWFFIFRNLSLNRDSNCSSVTLLSACSTNIFNITVSSNVGRSRPSSFVLKSR